MPNSTFYVKNLAGKLVAAKFLSYNGHLIFDSNTDEAKRTKLYDANGVLLPIQNPSGQLIVPVDYEVQNAMNFAKHVSDSGVASYILSGGDDVSGLLSKLALMTGAFFTHGPQDLQKTYDGKFWQSDVPAFKDAASFHLGIVTAYSGLPLKLAELGGGTLNRMNDALRVSFGEAPLDTKGAVGLSQENTKSILAGYAFGTKLPGSLSSPLPEPDQPHAGTKTSSVQSGRRDIRDIAIEASAGTRHGTGLLEIALRHGTLSPGGFAPVAATRGPRMKPPTPRGAADSAGQTAHSASLAMDSSAGPGQTVGTPPASKLGPEYRKILDDAYTQAAAARAKRGVTARTPLQGHGLAAGGHSALMPRQLRGVGAFPPPHAPVTAEAEDLTPHAALAGDAHIAQSAHHESPGNAVSATRLRPDMPHEAVQAAGMAHPALPAAQSPITQETLGEALDEYFYRQSRLAPASAPSFNPLLTPPWAGVTLPE